MDEGAPYYGIEACNEVLIGYNHIIGPALKQECLCTRAALLLKVLNITKLRIRFFFHLLSVQFSFSILMIGTSFEINSTSRGSGKTMLIWL